MKKLVFALITAVFALSLITCDFFGPPGVAAEFDYDNLNPGEFYITAGTGGNRALTGALARAGADFFEVVLDDGAKVFRTTFREGRNGRMEAPSMGTYNNSATLKAYLFAGRYDDKTLLAIGTITHVDVGSGLVTGSAISAATKAVQFTLQPLTTDVNTENDDTSTFKPWNATGIGTADEAEMSKKIMVDGMPAPIFLLPHTSSIVDAPYNIVTTHGVALMVASGAVANGNTPKVTPRGFIWPDGDYAPIEVAATISNATPGSALVLPLLLNINTSVTLGTTPITSGLGRLSIEVPVVNLTQADSDNQDLPDLKAPILWFIRGGINNAIIDQGPAFNNGRGSMGGAILIGVGSVLTGVGGFVVGTINP